jgi:Flp pilus assembly protein TadG
METGGNIDLRNIPRERASLRVCLRGLRAETGSALIELALVVGLLGVPMLLGTAEMGILAYDSIEVTDAANAGALYGMRSSTFSADTTGITTAAKAEASDFATIMTVTPTTYYVCATAVTGTQYTGTNAQTNAAAACTGTNNHALQFVQVGTSVSVTPPILCPGLPKTFTLHGTSVMEVEQ